MALAFSGPRQREPRCRSFGRLRARLKGGDEAVALATDGVGEKGTGCGREGGSGPADEGDKVLGVGTDPIGTIRKRVPQETGVQQRVSIRSKTRHESNYVLKTLAIRSRSDREVS